MHNKERVMKELQNVLNYSAESRPLDTEERGGGGEVERGAVSKKKMGGLRASGWSKNMEVGRAPRAPTLDPPLAH